MDEQSRLGFRPSFAQLRRQRTRRMRQFYWFMQGLGALVLIGSAAVMLHIWGCING